VNPADERHPIPENPFCVRQYSDWTRRAILGFSATSSSQLTTFVPGYASSESTVGWVTLPGRSKMRPPLLKTMFKWQSREQRSEPDPADLAAMNLHKQLAAPFVILALAECTQMATGQEPTPYAPYSRDSGADMRSGPDGSGGER
jgi:hypothetical protein